MKKLNHIAFDEQKQELHLLDQRLLPNAREIFICRKSADVGAALKQMVVRGAPAIGVTAAYGCALAAHEVEGRQNWRQKLKNLLDDLAAARPTAVNLKWAVDQFSTTIDDAENIEALRAHWLARAERMAVEDVKICEAIGHAGAGLIRDGDTVLTHCNAGALATAGYGTALGVIRAAVEQGKRVKVIADETRPFLQGARLTAYELACDGIPVTVACDNACALLFQKKLAQLVITGADRVAANGDAANKIGTLGVAILARYFNVPFYIACPLSTIDINTESGAEIPIEERPASEVETIGSTTIVPAGVPVYNYAFDVTPADLIAGIITEKGILRPPYSESIRNITQNFDKT